MIISRKKIQKIRQEAYEQGLNKGYDLCWQMRQSNLSNKGFVIAGALLDRELDEIQAKMGGEE